MAYTEKNSSGTKSAPEDRNKADRIRKQAETTAARGVVVTQRINRTTDTWAAQQSKK